MNMLRKYWLIVVFGVMLLVGMLNIHVVLKVLGKIFLVLKPLIVGFSMAFIFNIPYSFLHDKVFRKDLLKTRYWQGIRKPLALTFTYIFVFGVVALVIFLVIPAIYNSVYGIIEHFPTYSKNFGEWAVRTSERLGVDSLMIERLLNTMRDSLKDLTVLTAEALSKVINVAINFTGTVLMLILALFFSIYMLADKEELIKSISRLNKAVNSPERAEAFSRITSRTSLIFKRFIGGQLLDAVALGIICFIGMSILKLPYAVLVSTIISITSLIPYVGGIIGAIPSIIIIALVSFKMAIIFTIFITILQQFNGSVMSPLIVGEAIGIDGFLVMVAITFGGGLFGITGMLLGVPLIAVIRSLVSEWIDRRLSKNPKQIT